MVSWCIGQQRFSVGVARKGKEFKMISFKCSKAESVTIGKIVDRAEIAALKHGIDDFDAKTLHMDITACHCNGNPLRLDEMLAADDANFGHDVWGIRRYMDRTTGQLTDCFSPRFSA